MAESKVAKLLNEQITKEFYSAYLYLDFANYYDELSLKGYKNWFMVQAQEERDHAMLFIQYMQQNDMKITLGTIDKPENKFKDFTDPLKASLNHEKYVTELIHKIYAEAQKANDFRCMQFLDWFIKEQAEEEDNARTNLQRAELFGQDQKTLYQLDQEMQTRAYTAPSLVIG